MDRSSGKRSAGGLVTRTKARISGLKDAASQGDEGAQFCNRIGCRGRIKYSHNTRTGSSDKAHQKKLASQWNSDPSESSLSSKSEAPELMSSPSGYQSESRKKLGEDIVRETRRLRISSNGLMSSPGSQTGGRSESMKKCGEVTVRETRKLGISANALMSSPSNRTSDQLEPKKKSLEITARETRRLKTSVNALVSSPSSGTRDQSESMKKSGEVTVREMRTPQLSPNALMPSPSNRTADQSESTKKLGSVTVTGSGRPRASLNALMSSPSTRTRDHSESKIKSGDVTVKETVRPRVSTNVRPRIPFHDKSRLHNQNTPPSASVPLASESSTSVGASDVPAGSSMESESAGTERSSVIKNNPSRRAIKTTTASTIDRNNFPLTRGISISDSRSSSGTASVPNCRLANLNVRARISSQQNRRSSSSISRPTARISQSPDNAGNQSSPRHLSVGVSPSGSRLSIPSNNNDDLEHGFTRSVNHAILHQHTMDRIAEEFRTLARFEQDEEWTDDEALGLYLGNLEDQHRDMRLDIDNMSYEELLALEERMGTVSTALSEEALSKCLRGSIYQLNPSKAETTGTGEDEEDIKCSICQEEYVTGDELGKLVDCQHRYHVSCINKWLQLKNWCPICKASAGPSQSSLSL